MLKLDSAPCRCTALPSHVNIQCRCDTTLPICSRCDATCCHLMSMLDRTRSPCGVPAGKLLSATRYLQCKAFKRRYECLKTSMISRYAVKLQMVPATLYLAAFIISMNSSKQMSASCGPGEASGWYWIASAFFSGHLMPAHVPAYQTRHIVAAPDASLQRDMYPLVCGILFQSHRDTHRCNIAVAKTQSGRSSRAARQPAVSCRAPSFKFKCDTWTSLGRLFGSTAKL